MHTSRDIPQFNLCFYEAGLTDGEFVAMPAMATPLFCPVEYSWFKYGCLSIAEQYSEALASVLTPHLMQLVKPGEQVVVMGTPYKNLPNAAKLLAGSAERILRKAGFPTSLTRIYQYHLGSGDYAGLSLAGREARNGAKKRAFDPAEFIGKHVVVIDDVRITGSVERSIMALLASLDILSMTFVNLMKLDPKLAEAKPQIESELNQHAVEGLAELGNLMMDRGNFTLTTRAIRFVLESNPDEVQWLLDNLPDHDRRLLYNGAVDDGYDRMEKYQKTFALVCSK